MNTGYFTSQLPLVHSMGVLLFDPIWMEKKHDTHCCELIHVIRGQVEVVLPRQRIAAKPGDTLLIPTHIPHRDCFDISTGLEVFMVFFSWAGEKDFFSLVSYADLPALPEALKETVGRQVLRLRRDFTRGIGSAELLARVTVLEILLQLLADALRQRRHKACDRLGAAEFGRQRRRWLFDQAKLYLEANYRQPVALEDIAKSLQVSPYHLSHVFSAEGNFTLFEFLTRLRMDKARHLLEDGRQTVAEVAYAVGFDNSNYFSKVFHRHFGFRPRDVQRRRRD